MNVFPKGSNQQATKIPHPGEKRALHRTFSRRCYSSAVRVLHLASSNRWTGAAAPAFAEVEALRSAGVEAHYAYVGGYKLEARIGHEPFAHPLIRKKQHPVAIARSVAAIRRFIRDHDISIVHAHLTYDHFLAVAASRSGVRVVRTYHAARALRTDPLSRLLLRQTSGIAVINSELAAHPLLLRRVAATTPPPVDTRFFTPRGANVREALGFTTSDFVLGIIGKVSPRRGFEEAILTLAHLRRSLRQAKLMIIGHGPHRPFLEEMIRELGLTSVVVWAGYHEDDLAEHYRAADVMLFTAPGSDEGHRAVLEELACGRPVAAYPVAGMHDLLGQRDWISTEPSPAALARIIETLQRSDRTARENAAAARARAFDYAAAAARLQALYASL